MRNANRILLIIISLVSVLTSCTATYHLYDNNMLTNDAQLAELVGYFDWGDWAKQNSVDINSIKITQVDDTIAPCKGLFCMKRWFGSSWDGSYRIKLLPGEHVIHFNFRANHAKKVIRNYQSVTAIYPKFEYSLKFNAEAGHRYIIRAEYSVEDDKSSAWIKDITE